MKRGLVIRTAGDMSLSTPMAQQLQSQELTVVREELVKTKEELEKAMRDKYRTENAELGVRKAADNIEYNRKIRRARHRYKVRKPNKVESVFLVVWALLWLGIFTAADRLAAWNRN